MVLRFYWVCGLVILRLSCHFVVVLVVLQYVHVGVMLLFLSVATSTSTNQLATRSSIGNHVMPNQVNHDARELFS